MARQARTATEALARRVDAAHPTDRGCHLFIGSKDSGGYGNLWAEGKYHLPHRLSWQLANGPIPEGYDVCHTCDTPACCRLSHLFLGTAQQNTADMYAKGRAAIGVRNGSAKLTETEVRRIRRLHTEGNTGKQIAATFGVSGMTISRIVRGVNWRHVA